MSAASELRDSVQRLVDKFKLDEAQGYRSKSRQYAIDILGMALKQYEADAGEEHYARAEKREMREPRDFQDLEQSDG